MKVISNSSILIALSCIGQLSLLPKRFPQGILIPQAVWHEVVDKGQGRIGVNDIHEADWISVYQLEDNELVTLLHTELDKGESEAIALCIKEQADIILLDERKARNKASSLHLKVLGTIGILIWAKRVGQIDSLKQQLDALQTIGNFHISKALYEAALRSVKEGLL